MTTRPGHSTPPATLGLRARCAGVGFIVASLGTTWVHREIFAAARHSPARFGELAVGLLTFTLASVGILLLIHGARLFARDDHAQP